MNCDYKVDSCPFCGCAEIEMMKIYDTGGWYLRCGDCRVETPVYSTLQLAIKKWNRRERSIRRGKWIEQKGILHPLEVDGICNICGYTTGFYKFYDYCPKCGAKIEVR